MKNLWGYRGGLEQLRLSVTGLIIHERIELKENRGIMTRQYTERLISDAVMYGDTHKHTMEMASWWLDSDRAAIHKLFKVLVPRFRDLEGPTSFTRLFFSPTRILTNFENFKDKYGDFVTVGRSIKSVFFEMKCLRKRLQMIKMDMHSSRNLPAS